MKRSILMFLAAAMIVPSLAFAQMSETHHMTRHERHVAHMEKLRQEREARAEKLRQERAAREARKHHRHHHRHPTETMAPAVVH